MLNIKHKGHDAMRNLIPPGAVPYQLAFGKERHVCTQAVPCHFLRSHQPLYNGDVFSLAHAACIKVAVFFLPKDCTRKRVERNGCLICLPIILTH